MFKKMFCLVCLVLVLGVATRTLADWSDDFSEDPPVIVAPGRNSAFLDQNSAAGIYTVENGAGVEAFGWVPEGYITMVNDNQNPRGFGYLVDAGPNPGQIAPGTYEFSADMTWDDNSHATLVDVYVLSGSWSVGFRGGPTDPTEEGIRSVIGMTNDAALAMKVGSVFLPDGTTSTEESPVDITIPDVVVTEGSKVLMFCYFIALSGDGLRVNSMALSRPGAATGADVLQPADEATDVVRDGVVLEWKPGVYADQHDVYFGTTFDDVNDATTAVDPAGVYRDRRDVSSYAVGERLDFGQTYYWRVDEVNAPPDSTIFRGDVWSFTVEPVAIEIEDVNATASSANRPEEGPENTVNGSGLDDDDLHSSESADMWLSSAVDPNVWIQYEFDGIQKLYQMQVWNYNSTVEPLIGFGVREATIEHSVDGVAWTTLGATHEFARGPGVAGYAADTTIDFAGAAAKYVKITVNSNWGGIVAQSGLSEVRFLSLPVSAREPNPDSGATDVDVNVTLNWRSGREADKHDVYLSSDEQAVIDGNVPATTVTEAAYTTSLDLAGTYYWRVDEVNDAEAPTMWQGDVWDFTTQEYLVVDDFESYNDILAGEEGSRLVYEIWSDGFTDPSKGGSQIGYFIGTSVETATVFDGQQSVPLLYDNTVAVSSEVTANVADLQAGQDWTKHGVKALTLRFYGDPNNSVTDQMYVKLDGVKIPYDGDAENLTRIGWQMWYIDLASTGVNFANVTTLSVGFERIGAVGGQGVVLLDGIRLYSFDRQLITAVDPGTAGLQAQYEFEGTANDSSVNARHGTIVGNPTFVAGKVGQAIDLRGLDYVEITGYKGILGPNAVTVTAWINTTATETGTIVGWGPVVDGQRFGFRMNAGRLRLEVGGGNIQGDGSMNDGGWHHVAVTVQENATASYPEVILYLDGVDDTRPTTDLDPVFDLTAGEDVRIGRRPASNDRYFVGQIDEVRIYNRALSPEEAAWLAGRFEPFDEPF